jgi:hypothetical protein
MGPEPIKIPDYFTVSYYRSLKEQNKTDQMIADELLISKPTLNNWKRKIGYVPFTSKKIAGRKPTVDPGIIAEKRKRGMKYTEIADEVGLSVRAVQYALEKLGLTRTSVNGRM